MKTNYIIPDSLKRKALNFKCIKKSWKKVLKLFVQEDSNESTFFLNSQREYVNLSKCHLFKDSRRMSV